MKKDDTAYTVKITECEPVMEILRDYKDFLTAIVRSQDVLAEYLSPENPMSIQSAISELLGILDDRKLVELVNKYEKMSDDAEQVAVRRPETVRGKFSFQREEGASLL